MCAAMDGGQLLFASISNYAFPFLPLSIKTAPPCGGIVVIQKLGPSEQFCIFNCVFLSIYLEKDDWKHKLLSSDILLYTY